MTARNHDSVGVAIIGVGTVGGGVVRLLREQRDVLRRRIGRDIRVVHAVKRDLAKVGGLDEETRAILSADWRAAVADEKTDIVVELMGGETESALCIRAALAAGKRVATANKALLAATAATDGIAGAAHEAAIAGCIPIVKILREALAGDTTREIYGVINGTCNYILTAMESSRRPFADALREAQRLGYAEADPALDIDGMDSAHKLLLLARLAFGGDASMSDLPVIGVRDFDERDIRFARQFNFRVKLLAVAKRASGEKLELRVRPTLIPRHHPLAAVEGAMNAVVIRADYSGETMHCGAGAGARPTAVAVVADIIDIIRRQAISANGVGAGPAPPLARSFSAPHYLRLRVIDRPGVLADVTRLLAAQNISIEAIHQNESLPGEIVDIIILSHDCDSQDIAAAAAAMRELPVVKAPIVILPIERLS